jgi:HEAT repeat protein
MKRMHVWFGVALLVCLGAGASGCGDSRRVDYSIDSLRKTLKDNDPKMRYWAAESLGHFGPEAHSTVPDLIGALKDQDGTVRQGVAYALAEMGAAAADALPALQEAARDPQPEVRTAAAYALKQIQQKKKGPTR